MICRREFLMGTFAGLIRRESDIALADYHVHLDDRWGMTLERALALSRERGVKFGIVEHAGTKDKPYRNIISDDEALRKYLARLRNTPFYKGIQAEGLDWMTCFTPSLVAQLDYVLSDALTLPNKDGSYTELWHPQVRVENKQEFMDRYLEFHLQVISREPIDILANPLYLPECLQPEFDALWTDARMEKIVQAARKYGVAIEINELFRLPGARFIQMARAAGVKFSFGSNHHSDAVGRMDYALEVVRTLGLKPSEIWTPAPYGRKPVQIRKS